MLNITLDHAQIRVDPRKGYIASSITGAYERDPYNDSVNIGWSPYWGTKDANDDNLTFVDPVTYTLMLTPAPMLKAWNSNSTGIYTRLKLADYDAITLPVGATARDEKKTDDHASYLVISDSTATAQVTTSVVWPKNRPFYLGTYVHGWGSNNGSVTIRAGWGSTSSGVYVEFRSDGRCKVFKDGVFQQSYPISGKDQPSNIERGFVKFFLIPCRKRDLLVLSNAGNGFVHTFQDIDEDDDDPTITPADKFFWQVLGGKTEVECAPIRFPSSAYRSSLKCIFSRPPQTGSTIGTTLFSDVPGYGTQSVALSVRNALADTAFVPDGIVTDFRMKASFTSDGESTPFVYAGLSDVSPEMTTTDGSESLIVTSDFLVGVSLEVPEDPGGVRMPITLKEPEAIEDISTRLISTISNRPIQATIDELTYEPGDGPIVMLNGIGGKPSTTDSWNDEVRRVQIEVRDKWKLLEKYRFKDPIPLDGLNVGDALALICDAAGIDSTEREFSTFTAPIRSSPGCSRGDWNFVITPDMTADDAIRRIHESYLPDHFIGIRPTATIPQLWIKSQGDMGVTPVLTLFDNADAAIQYGVTVMGETEAVARSKVKTRVYYDYKGDDLEIEANEIWVEGLDPRTRRPILTCARDEDSLDPTLAPSLRSDNWLGEGRRYGLSEPAFSFQSECDSAADLLKKRLTGVRYMGEINTNFLIIEATRIPVWKGDVITLQNKGDFRIQAFHVEEFRELGLDESGLNYAEHAVQWRPAHYVLERLVPERDDTSGLGHKRTIGTTLDEIRESWQLGFLSFGVWSKNPTSKRPPINQTQL